MLLTFDIKLEKVSFFNSNIWKQKAWSFKVLREEVIVYKSRFKPTDSLFQSNQAEA